MIELIRITRIAVETLAHATEDLARVNQAMRNLLTNFEERHVRGYFGNTIVVLSGKLEKKKEIEAFMRNLRRMIPKEAIDFERCTDEEGPLYLRLDKQKLYKGLFTLRNDGDVKITIGIQAYPHKKEEVVQNARKIFEGH